MVHKVDINLLSLYRTFGENTNVVRELIHIFLKNKPAEILDLSKAIYSEDWEQARLAAHKLKSGFRIMGMTSLTTLAEKMELACAKGNPNIENLRKDLKAIQLQSEEAYALLKAELRSKT